jgi:hypothetical protein
MYAQFLSCLLSLVDTVDEADFARPSVSWSSVPLSRFCSRHAHGDQTSEVLPESTRKVFENIGKCNPSRHLLRRAGLILFVSIGQKLVHGKHVYLKPCENQMFPPSIGPLACKHKALAPRKQELRPDFTGHLIDLLSGYAEGALVATRFLDPSP